MFPFYLGIDLHLKRSYMVLMNAEGEVIDKRSLKNTEMASYITKKIPKETYAVMEATRNWPFFYDLLDKHVDRVELAHAKGVRMIAAAAVKTDQIDASVLAHLARLNFLPIAYAAPKEIRDLRQHLRYREWLIDERRRAKNRIHAVLASSALGICFWESFFVVFFLRVMDLPSFSFWYSIYTLNFTLSKCIHRRLGWLVVMVWQSLRRFSQKWRSY